MPEPNVGLTDAQRRLLQYVLVGTGHFEIQQANTGAPGFKIGDSKWVSGLSSRVGPYFAQLMEGNSRSFGS